MIDWPSTLEEYGVQIREGRSPRGFSAVSCSVSDRTQTKARYYDGFFANKKVSLKVFLKSELDLALVKEVQQEVVVHSQLQHDYILNIYHAFEDDRKIVLVLERASGVASQLPLQSEEQVRGKFYYVLRALAYIHSLRYLHRNIALGSLFIVNDSLKIGNFNHIRRFQEAQDVTASLDSGSLGYPQEDLMALGRAAHTLLTGVNFALAPSLSSNCEKWIESTRWTTCEESLRHPFMMPHILYDEKRSRTRSCPAPASIRDLSTTAGFSSAQSSRGGLVSSRAGALPCDSARTFGACSISERVARAGALPCDSARTFGACSISERVAPERAKAECRHSDEGWLAGTKERDSVGPKVPTDTGCVGALYDRQHETDGTPRISAATGGALYMSKNKTESIGRTYERKNETDGTPRINDAIGGALYMRKNETESIGRTYERKNEMDGTPRINAAIGGALYMRKNETESIGRTYERKNETDATPRASSAIGGALYLRKYEMDGTPRIADAASIWNRVPPRRAHTLGEGNFRPRERTVGPCTLPRTDHLSVYRMNPRLAEHHPGAEFQFRSESHSSKSYLEPKSDTWGESSRVQVSAPTVGARLPAQFSLPVTPKDVRTQLGAPQVWAPTDCLGVPAQVSASQAALKPVGSRLGAATDYAARPAQFGLPVSTKGVQTHLGTPQVVAPTDCMRRPALLASHTALRDCRAHLSAPQVAAQTDCVRLLAQFDTSQAAPKDSLAHLDVPQAAMQDDADLVGFGFELGSSLAGSPAQDASEKASLCDYLPSGGPPDSPWNTPATKLIRTEIRTPIRCRSLFARMEKDDNAISPALSRAGTRESDISFKISSWVNWVVDDPGDSVRQSPVRRNVGRRQDRKSPIRRNVSSALSCSRNEKRESPVRRNIERILSPVRRNIERILSPVRRNIERFSPVRRNIERFSPSRYVKRESPVSRSEKQQSPVSRSEKRESPIRRSEKQDSPRRRYVKRECPMRRSQKQQSPVSRSEKQESPVRRSEKRESPRRRYARRESPVRRSEKRVSPVRRSEKQQSPIRRSEKQESPHRQNVDPTPKPEPQCTSVSELCRRMRLWESERSTAYSIVRSASVTQKHDSPAYQAHAIQAQLSSVHDERTRTPRTRVAERQPTPVRTIEELFAKTKSLTEQAEWLLSRPAPRTMFREVS